MELNIFDTQPGPIMEYLIQQVEKQSDVCDITVKMESWEKKFHKCVLIVSPFFEHCLKNEFLEKQTGIIKMAIGTPETLEMAIMFLYGRLPTITEENIRLLLELAEFLLIPNLKSACIEWITYEHVTTENCMTFLQLSSTYNFELPGCISFIERHMLFHTHPQMLNLTTQSVKQLFSDQKLSYVAMEDKLNFLLNWVSKKSSKVSSEFKDLFQLIDYTEVSRSVLTELKGNRAVRDLVDIDSVSSFKENEMSDTHPVLIITDCMNNGVFWCFDLVRNRWFRLNSESYKGEISYRYKMISGLGNANSEICFTCLPLESTVLILNLETDTCRTYRLVEDQNDFDVSMCTDLQLLGGFCIASVNKQVERKILTCNELRQYLMFDQIQNTYVDTLYVGRIEGDFIEMSALLTFKNDAISKFNINKQLQVAVLAGQTISILDLNNYSMKTFQLNITVNDKLMSTNEGFVLYNNARCIDISKSRISSDFQVKEVTFKSCFERPSDILAFCHNTWFHLHRCTLCSWTDVFKSTPHSHLKAECTIDNVVWKELSLPEKVRHLMKTLMTDRLIEVCLPKSKLRCDIDCPHCEKTSSYFDPFFIYCHDCDDSSNDDDFQEVDEEEEDVFVEEEEHVVEEEEDVVEEEQDVERGQYENVVEEQEDIVEEEQDVVEEPYENVVEEEEDVVEEEDDNVEEQYEDVFQEEEDGEDEIFEDDVKEREENELEIGYQEVVVVDEDRIDEDVVAEDEQEKNICTGRNIRFEG